MCFALAQVSMHDSQERTKHCVVSLVKPSLTCERIGEDVFHPSLLVMEAEDKGTVA